MTLKYFVKTCDEFIASKNDIVRLLKFINIRRSQTYGWSYRNTACL